MRKTENEDADNSRARVLWKLSYYIVGQLLWLSYGPKFGLSPLALFELRVGLLVLLGARIENQA